MAVIDEPDMEFVHNDTCRAALIIAVSALDSYMHWLIYDKLSDIRKGKDIPGSLRKVAVSFVDIAELADAVLADREKIRPWVKVKNTLQKKLLTETFQSFEQVGTAMSMAGITEGWKKVSAEIGETSPEIKKRLNHIVHRRNQIVHEGDVMRKSRPRNVLLND
ncbi:HEPN domain-containing protein, partial [Pseudomonas sp. HS6-2]